MRLLLAAAVLVLPAAAIGQPLDRVARSHFDAGQSYYDEGRYEDALREFEEAYRAAPERLKSVMLFNVGQAQERLGRLQDAIETFRRCLATGDPSDSAVLQARVQNLQARLDATGIVLTVSEAGARVSVDGESRGTTPLTGPLRVPPGAHEIVVEKEGFQTFSLRVSVPAGERVEATATLVASVPAVPPVPGPERVPAPAPPPPPIEPPAPHRQPPPEPPPPAPPRGRSLTWVAAAVAGGAAIGGGILGVLALGKSDDANATAEEGTDGAAYDDQRSSAKTLAAFADVSFGLAVVAAGAAVVLYFVESPPASPDRAARVLPIALPDGAGLGVSGAF